MASQIVFSIQMLENKDGKRLKAVKPNARGIYEKVPMGLFGRASRNMNRYDDGSMVRSMTDPSTRFCKLLQEGNLLGENGHPMIFTKEQLPRLTLIDMNNVSHRFLKMQADGTGDNCTLLWGDVKPAGPKGPLLTESFADPDGNTCFSMRSLTTEPEMVGGVRHRKVLMMVTFDFVDGPGFEEACKRFMATGTEDFHGLSVADRGIEYNCSMEDFLTLESAKGCYGIEAVTSQEVLDKFQENFVNIRNEICGILDLQTKQLTMPTGQHRSVFHTVFR